MAKGSSSKKKIETQEDLPQTDAGAGVEEITLGGGATDAAGNGVEELDALLGDLEVELSTTAVIVGGDMPLAPADRLIQDLAALDAELDSVGTSDVGDASTVLGVDLTVGTIGDDLKAAAAEELNEQQPTPPAPAADDKKPAPQTKRINTMGMKKSEALVKSLGAKAADYLTLNMADIELPEAEQKAKHQALLETIDGLPIKIGEKVVNLYAHIANGATLSNYTKMAIYLLVKDGELSSKTLKDAYIARPYTEGTANSQATQMMKLLPTLGLATRSAGKLIVNPDSVLLPSIQV